jgi:hypothetical protein
VAAEPKDVGAETSFNARGLQNPANPFNGADRRKKQSKPLIVDPGKRVVLPADYYIDSWLKPPTAVKPPILSNVVERVPMEPTRIDIWLPEPKPNDPEPDFILPAEEPYWVLWVLAQQEREAMDNIGSTFSETITLEGPTADIKVINLSTKRVMESQQRRFRFAIDPLIDAVDPDLPRESAPFHIEGGDPSADRIRAISAEGRRIDALYEARRAREASRPRSQIPWGYVAGLLSALAFLGAARFLHLFT